MGRETVGHKGGPHIAETDDPGGPLRAGDQIFRDMSPYRSYTGYKFAESSASPAHSKLSTRDPFERIWLRVSSKRSLSSTELALSFYVAPILRPSFPTLRQTDKS